MTRDGGPVGEPLPRGDRRLVALVDEATGRARDRAGPHLTCQAGCSPCCFGPFAITQLDAWRLRRGLNRLAETNVGRANGVRRRAHAAVETQSPVFPSGRVGLFATEAEEHRFYRQFESSPCPALDPDSGACVVYEWRPLVCRTYGPPVRIDGDDFPPCPLCFTKATSDEVEAARQPIDVSVEEAPLVDAAETEFGRRGMTTVAFALAEDTAGW
ncbi:MAG: YkgJ family cysteine cluster protein [Acidobacteriota bacterium]|nr:YkgJ family cysteine cluster protein [Acidobacteriota bacterium]